MSGEKRLVRHFWMSSWPDHEAPLGVAGHLATLVQSSLISSSDNLAPSVEKEGPILVHCSAGLGRTGCFLTVALCAQQYRLSAEIDVLRNVARLRLDRLLASFSI